MVQKRSRGQDPLPLNLSLNKENEPAIVDEDDKATTAKRSTHLEFGCVDHWSWDTNDKSHEVRLHGADHRIVCFHPNWSSGTAGVRGARALDGRRFYWELHLTQRVFGTSIMVGVATKAARLHSNSFTNLLGEDAHGWGLSHKGLLWHNGRWSKYTSPFTENQATTIGLLYDGVAGTLTYYKDNVCLGVAFHDLHRSSSTLYPFACSTAAKTKMSLANMRRDFVNLQDRCRDVIASRLRSREGLTALGLPLCLSRYIAQAFPDSSARIFLEANLNTIIDM